MLTGKSRVPPGSYIDGDGSLVTSDQAYGNIIINHGGKVVCCSVLQFVAVCCSLLQFVAVCCSMLQCVVVCCSESTGNTIIHQAGTRCQQIATHRNTLHHGNIIINYGGKVVVAVCVYVYICIYFLYIPTHTHTHTHARTHTHTRTHPPTHPPTQAHIYR